MTVLDAVIFIHAYPEVPRLKWLSGIRVNVADLSAQGSDSCCCDFIINNVYKDFSSGFVFKKSICPDFVFITHINNDTDSNTRISKDKRLCIE